MTIIKHYGTPRRSGRYPWGSGGDTVSAGELMSAIESLQNKGLSQTEIAKGLGMSTTEMRLQKTLASGELKEAQRINVVQQRDNGMSVAAISREFHIPESTIRDLLKDSANLRYRGIKKIADGLAAMVDKYKFLDVGKGSELFMAVTRGKLNSALKMLTNEGYILHTVYQEQLDTPTGKKSKIQVLTGPDVSYKEVMANKPNIKIPNFSVKDSGDLTFLPDAINNMSSDRILFVDKNNGGLDKDGLIELRRGVPELNLGDKAYAQVRIGVDGSHFMKGMAVHRDDLPDGVDAIFYTSKELGKNKLDVLKPQKEEGASRFGSVVRPNSYLDDDGNEVFGIVNILGTKETPNVEGAWANWNRNIASQVLSKQPPDLARKQLEIVFENYKAELDDISKLTNPTVKNHLLIEFADKADKAGYELKASALPRQTTNVILPDPKLKPTEIYAPNYDNGEVVSLIRYPHGGIFEIPTLKVNNKYSEYKDIIGSAAPDAVAINPKVANKLSGADFDGDTVVVIPNKRKELRTAPSLEALKNFDHREKYKYFDGMDVMEDKSTNRHMGEISNLITDMTIQGAPEQEIARAVKHSMVVIDAAKHKLNYRQSYDDNAIAALKTRYQGGPRGGASTLISKAKGQKRVGTRHDHYAINPKTGKKEWTYTEETWTDSKTGKERPRTIKSYNLAEAESRSKINKLSSGTVIEKVYVDHSLRMKDLGNKARLASLKSKDTTYSSDARKTYIDEVRSLEIKHKAALKHKPIERKAQVVGEQIYKLKESANPNMSYSDKRKEKAASLKVARARLESTKPTIDITPREWQAIEAGAVSPTKLKSILRNADMDKVREYATPRAAQTTLSGAKETRAKALLKSGYTSAEIANALGVPVHRVQEIRKE